MRYFKKLIGKKVYLSPMNPEDVELYTKWISDLKVSIPLGNASSIFSLEAEKEMLEQMSKEKEKFNFAIVRLDNDELIGNCSLFDVNTIHQNAEIGIFIGDKVNWGKGYGSEAMKLALEFGFKIVGLHNVMLKVFSFNERAVATYKNIGFKLIGKRRQAFRINNKRHDELYFEILANELDSHLLDNVLP